MGARSPPHRHDRCGTRRETPPRTAAQAKREPSVISEEGGRLRSAGGGMLRLELSRRPREPWRASSVSKQSSHRRPKTRPFRSAGGPRARPATPTRSNHNDGTRRNDASGAAARRPAYSSRSRGGGVRRHPPELPWNQPVARQRSARRSDRPGGRFSIGRLYRSSSPSTGSLRNPIYPTMLVGFLGLCHYGADSKAATTMTLV